MTFRVVDSHGAASSGNEVLLVRDNWNDWYVWYTQFQVVVAWAGQPRITLGSVKVGRRGMTRENARTPVPTSFAALDEPFFSIGQSENYYETLNTLGEDFRTWLLTALRDCARDLSILDANVEEEVLRESLLRDIESSRVRHRFHRLANGNPALSAYAFRYTFPTDPKAASPPPVLQFQVSPGAWPPTNVHVLIGRNGVGKSRCFDFLSRSFLGISGPGGEETGAITPLRVGWGDMGSGFAGLVTVSFSPFDKYGPLVTKSSDQKVRYDYVGLIKNTAAPVGASSAGQTHAAPAPSIKSHEDLIEEFVASVRICREGARRDRWERVLRMLEADPLFEEINVAAFAAANASDWEANARSRFRRLSSGHSVVLLTVTRLVELVEESSLVLIDEPECHLHPPLLSAFVRALSDLLIDRNGVAIVATHSPVVLQEAPRHCCWILNRSGHEARADRPELECFGENVGVLTREVFGLEVVQTGFHRMVAQASGGKTYSEVVAKFEGHLGAEARALARVLTLISPDNVADDEAD